MVVRRSAPDGVCFCYAIGIQQPRTRGLEQLVEPMFGIGQAHAHWCANHPDIRHGCASRADAARRLCPETATEESYDAGVNATPTRGMIGFLEIDRDGCMRMLAAASGGVGRIAFSVPGSRASIRPVNYAFDEPTQSVVFRSALGSRLLAALSSGPATFEIDGGDPVERTGWSVIIAGQGEEVTDPAEIERLEAFELEPWAPGLKTHWVRIRATSVSGRRIVRLSDAMLD